MTLVRMPTLFIVGGADNVVLDLNRRARAQLTCESRLAVIPGATHLFEEPGARSDRAPQKTQRRWPLDPPRPLPSSRQHIRQPMPWRALR